MTKRKDDSTTSGGKKLDVPQEEIEALNTAFDRRIRLHRQRMRKWDGMWPHLKVKNFEDWDERRLNIVREMAAFGRIMRTIAAHFRVKFKTFEDWTHRNKGDNPLRWAWEEGFAAFEQSHSDLLIDMAEGDTKTAAIAAIFLGKVKFGWRDRDVNTVTQSSSVQLVLPGREETPEQFYARLGRTGPDDGSIPMAERLRLKDERELAARVRALPMLGPPKEVQPCETSPPTTPAPDSQSPSTPTQQPPNPPS